MSDWYLEEPGAGGFGDETVRSVFLVSLFHFSAGRNAWWGAWSSCYENVYSFHPTFEEVSRRVEASRTRGTRWVINELPALAFASKAHALIAVEINSDRPFSDVSLDLLETPTLNGFAKVFRPLRPDSIWRFFVNSGRLKPVQLPFYKYTSASSGGQYELTWTPATRRYNLNRARSLIEDTKSRLRQFAKQARSTRISS